MGNINRPKLDTEDIELMRKIGKHNFVDMIYIYKFYKTDCKKRTVNERITQLASAVLKFIFHHVTYHSNLTLVIHAVTAGIFKNF